MKEREQINQAPRKEIRRLNQSEFLFFLEQARAQWVSQLEEVVDNINNIDHQRLRLDNAILDNQTIRYFREDSFNEKGEKISSRLYFETEPKKEIGFKK